MQRLLSITLLGTLLTLSSCEQAATAPPGRAFVVSLHDTTTELVVALGATDQLIAIGEPSYLSPSALAAIAGLKQLPGGPLSPEAVAGLKPTLVLGTDVIEERQPNLGPALQALGIETLWIDPAGLDGLISTTLELGDLLDCKPRAEALVARYREHLDLLAERAPEVGSDPVRVFFYDCCDPPFTAGGRAPLSELLTTLGARNVFDDLDQDWVAVSWEAVVARAPELIVVHDYTWGDQSETRDKLASLFERGFLAEVPAIEAGSVVTMPLGLALEGPRNLDALEWLLPAIIETFDERAEAAK